MNEDISERVFYDLLLRVGALGKYQYICLALWGLIYMISASTLYFNPFLFYQTPYECSDKTLKQCQRFVCSLPSQLRSQYLSADRPTFIDQFGDYRCENKATISTVEMLIYISGLAGIIIGTYLNSFIRKKLLLEASLITSLMCIVIQLFNNSFFIMVILMCVNYACQTVINDLSVCFMMQNVLEEKRGKHVMVLFIFLSVGCMANGFFFDIMPWRDVFCFYFITAMLSGVIGLKWYIKETPFDLVTNFTAEEAFRDFHWIAVQNGHHETHEISVKELAQIKQEYEQSLKSKSQHEFTMLDLFRYQSIRWDVIWCCVLHFFNFFSYSAPILALNQFSSSIYLNAIIFSTATLISSIFCYYLINDLSRKKMMSYTTFASIFFIIPLYLTSNCKGDCTSSHWIETISIFIFRILLQIAYQSYNFIQNQIFPTQIRSIAILVTGFFSSLTMMVIPVVSDINQKIDFFLPCAFIFSGIIVLIGASQIRQTLGVPPPEVIKELEFKHQVVEQKDDNNELASSK